MELQISDYAKQVSDLRTSSPKIDKYNMLITGDGGTGKTTMLATAQKPVWIDSFDPGGTESISKLIDGKTIFADTRFENEDPYKPSVWSLWLQEFDKKIRMNFFDKLGTYCIDSLTTFSAAKMNQILAMAGIAGQAPRWEKDYTPQKVEIQNKIIKMCSLPCTFVLTAHLDAQKDDLTGEVRFRPIITGDLKSRIYIFFDAVLVTQSKGTPQGLTYQIQTQNNGLYLARVRTKVEPYEEPNIRKIILAAGKKAEDKPPLII